VEKKIRALHFTRLVYCQQLSTKIPNYHTQTLNFTLKKDIKIIQTYCFYTQHFRTIWICNTSHE